MGDRLIAEVVEKPRVITRGDVISEKIESQVSDKLP